VSGFFLLAAELPHDNSQGGGAKPLSLITSEQGLFPLGGFGVTLGGGLGPLSVT